MSPRVTSSSSSSSARALRGSSVSDAYSAPSSGSAAGAGTNANPGGNAVCATIVGVKSTRVWFSSMGSGLAARSPHESHGETSSRRNRRTTSATSAAVTGLAFAFGAAPATFTRWLTANAPCRRIASMRPAGTTRLRGGGAFAQSDWSVANPLGPYGRFPFLARAAAAASATPRGLTARASRRAYALRRLARGGAGNAIVSMTYASSSSPTTSRITATSVDRGSSSSANARALPRAALRALAPACGCGTRGLGVAFARVSPPPGWSRRRARRCRRSAIPGARRTARIACRASRRTATPRPMPRRRAPATTAGTRLHFPHPGASQHTHASRTASGARGSQTDSEWHAHASSSDNFMCGCIAGPCEAASASSRTSAKSAPARYRAGGAASRVGGVLVGFGASSEGVPSTGLGFGGFCFDALDGSSSNSEGGSNAASWYRFVAPPTRSFRRMPTAAPRSSAARTPTFFALRSASACPFPAAYRASMMSTDRKPRAPAARAREPRRSRLCRSSIRRRYRRAA